MVESLKKKKILNLLKTRKSPDPLHNKHIRETEWRERRSDDGRERGGGREREEEKKETNGDNKKRLLLT